VQSHDFRTTKLSELIPTVGLKAAQMYVGHKKEATTLRYAKCGAQEGYEAVARASENVKKGQ